MFKRKIAAKIFIFVGFVSYYTDSCYFSSAWLYEDFGFNLNVLLGLLEPVVCLNSIVDFVQLGVIWLASEIERNTFASSVGGVELISLCNDLWLDGVRGWGVEGGGYVSSYFWVVSAKLIYNFVPEINVGGLSGLKEILFWSITLAIILGPLTYWIGNLYWALICDYLQEQRFRLLDWYPGFWFGLYEGSDVGVCMGHSTYWGIVGPQGLYNKVILLCKELDIIEGVPPIFMEMVYIYLYWRDVLIFPFGWAVSKIWLIWQWWVIFFDFTWWITVFWLKWVVNLAIISLNFLAGYSYVISCIYIWWGVSCSVVDYFMISHCRSLGLHLCWQYLWEGTANLWFGLGCGVVGCIFLAFFSYCVIEKYSFSVNVFRCGAHLGKYTWINPCRNFVLPLGCFGVWLSAITYNMDFSENFIWHVVDLRAFLWDIGLNFLWGSFYYFGLNSCLIIFSCSLLLSGLVCLFYVGGGFWSAHSPSCVSQLNFGVIQALMCYYLVVLGLLGLALFLLVTKFGMAGSYVIWLGTWWKTALFTVDWCFTFNSYTLLGLIMLFSVTLVILKISVNYVYTESRAFVFFCFFCFIHLFLIAMCFIILSNNLMVLFLGWEGVGLMSFLLIGFWHTRYNAIISALKAMLVNKLGDLFFLAALWVACVFGGSTEIATLQHDIGFTFLGTYTETEIFAWCLLIGCFVKSAQFTFQTWLADAMEGPTPVSALIHAATMVTAGVLVLLKFGILLILHEVLLNVLIIVGSITCFVGALAACYQWDLKKIVAYSTCSQLGYMFLAVGLGSPVAALMHLLMHAVFKAQLFILAGYIIHLDFEQDVRAKGQDLSRWLAFGHSVSQPKFLLASFILSSCNLMGFFITGGFFTKDLIIECGWFQSTNVAFFGFLLSTVAAILTFLYSGGLILYVSQALGFLKGGHISKFVGGYAVKVGISGFFTVGWISLANRAVGKLKWSGSSRSVENYYLTTLFGYLNSVGLLLGLFLGIYYSLNLFSSTLEQCGGIFSVGLKFTIRDFHNWFWLFFGVCCILVLVGWCVGGLKFSKTLIAADFVQGGCGRGFSSRFGKIIRFILDGFGWDSAYRLLALWWLRYCYLFYLYCDQSFLEIIGPTGVRVCVNFLVSDTWGGFQRLCWFFACILSFGLFLL